MIAYQVQQARPDGATMQRALWFSTGESLYVLLVVTLSFKGDVFPADDIFGPDVEKINRTKS